MAIKEVYEQIIHNYINEIRMDALDYYAAPPIDVGGMGINECLEKAEEYHKQGNVAAYLFFLAQATMRKEGVVS